MTKQITLPEDVNALLQTLNDGGYEAYIVGGCVRDSILGRIPQDWDITTSALPEQTKALFSHTFDTGIQHGTITVVLNKTNYEITTYRIDGDYADGRHPDEVSFTSNLEEDLLRKGSATLSADRRTSAVLSSAVWASLPSDSRKMLCGCCAVSVLRHSWAFRWTMPLTPHCRKTPHSLKKSV